MMVAGVAAWLCQRAGLSVIVGYLVAGALIGPYTPPFALVSDLHQVEALAQAGLLFQIFAIGLHLSLSRLKRLGLSLVGSTFISAIVILNGSRLFGLAFGWGVTPGLFLAGMLMVSSSAIISKILDELNLTHERPGQMALGTTVLEDVVAITMLTILTSLTQLGGEKPATLISTLGGLGAFVVFSALVSLLFVPRLLSRLSRNILPEIRTLIVTGLLLSLGWLAAAMGYSLALGAFVFGAIVGSTRHKAEVEDVFEGVRHLFGAVFFVAVGMQVDFRLLGEAWPLILAVTFLACVLRPVACSLGFLAVGNSTREAVQAGLILAPLGEFSFIIAQLGASSGATPKTFFPAAVGASLLISLIAPWLTKHSEAIAGRVARAEPPAFREWMVFYQDWLGRLRTRQSASLFWRLAGSRLLHLALQMLFSSALILLANPAYAWTRDKLGNDWVMPNGLMIIFWTLFGLLMLAPLIAVWRNVTTLAMILAEGAMQDSPRQRRLRPVLEFALRAVGLAVLGGWLIALLPNARSVLGVVAGMLLLLLLVGALFWRRMVLLHSRLEVELLHQFERASHTASASGLSPGLVAGTGDWDLEIDEVTLPMDTAHAGKSIGQLALRKHVGCSIVGIDRQGHAIANPGADEVLFPRDKLLLLGATAQLAKAARVLGGETNTGPEPSGFDELTMETVLVPEHSPLAGKALIELDLIRQVGVQIGGIRRAGRRRLTPSGRDHFLAGDELLVLGTQPQLKKLRALLEPGRSTRPPDPEPPEFPSI